MPWPESGPGGRTLAPRTAVVVTVLVFLGYTGVALAYVLAQHPGPLRLAGAAALLAVLLVLQLAHSFPGQVPALGRRWPLTLALQAAVTYLPVEFYGRLWIGMPSFLAASLLLLLPPAAGWAGFAAVVVASNLMMQWIGDGTGDAFYISVATVTNGLVVYGLSRLTDLVAEVHRSRAELAAVAVARERLRFARDLHDLLGYSLSAITLKCELAYRLVPEQAAPARQELADVLRTSRQALADVRAVARGYREMSLGAEAEGARAMLAALGVRASVRVAAGPLPPRVETVLATVLREGLTNMLRHSGVERCEISAVCDGRTVRFRLANDGAPLPGRPAEPGGAGAPDTAGGAGGASAAGAAGGSGIGNLAARVRELGGTLTAGPREPGWFVLEAVIDLDAAGGDDRRTPAPAAAGA
ncbi:hypothetical protein Kpho02_15800 [Kitasatospora phosalacinea]|uniref:Signal transduction histidine kinase subgroup 3 dimerisation and phosphoacceptor domain-containing protein n=1 Tax=Kitasatospora phosalacinea TaxID=2065 RepID=A0A9W6Q5S0_9ACTN|nr:hypothetical protein Kpho02_15800 [Kitasatospora phosalacinea]